MEETIVDFSLKMDFETMNNMKKLLSIITSFLLIPPALAKYEEMDTTICYTKRVSNDAVFELSPCRVAAEQGEHDALFSLGFGEINSQATSDNIKNSDTSYTKVERLGHRYRPKKSEEIDSDSFVRIIIEGAEQGHVKSQYVAGLIYDEGVHAEKNDDLAFHWYKESAMHGYKKGQYNLGHMYANGQGVDQDPIEAYAWWDLSITQGQDAAIANISIMLKEMTMSQIKKAKALSKKYHKQYLNSN